MYKNQISLCQCDDNAQYTAPCKLFSQNAIETEVTPVKVTAVQQTHKRDFKLILAKNQSCKFVPQAANSYYTAMAYRSFTYITFLLRTN